MAEHEPRTQIGRWRMAAEKVLLAHGASGQEPCHYRDIWSLMGNAGLERPATPDALLPVLRAMPKLQPDSGRVYFWPREA